MLSVVVAIELLGTGEPGAGALMTAVGVGPCSGSLAASLLVGTRRLGVWFAVGVALWGLPITLVGVVPQEAAALGLIAFVGVGNALIDVAGFTLMARMAPDEVLARVFGVLESLVARVHRDRGGRRLAGWSTQSGSEPALIGDRAGVPGPGRRCRGGGCAHSTAPSACTTRDVELLQRVPMLRTLPLPSIEHLARGLEPVVVPARSGGVQPGRSRRPLLRHRVR